MVAARTFTVDDLEQTPPDGDWSVNSWELVDGELVVVPPTSEAAGEIPLKLGYSLASVVYPNRLGRLYGADTGFKLFPDRETLRSPDLAFVCADRVPTGPDRDEFPRLAPDLAVEVRSPSDNWAPLLAKAAMYLEAGVRLVWLIDRRHRTVTVFTPDSSPVVLGEDDMLEGGDVLPGFSIPVAEIFS